MAKAKVRGDITARDGVSKVVRRIGRSFRRLGRGIGRGLAAPLRSVGSILTLDIGQVIGSVVTGFTGLVRKMVDVNRSFETTKLSFAILLRQSDRFDKTAPFRRFGEQFGRATQIFNDLRVAARETPASFDQLRESFSQLVFVGRKSGRTIKQLVDLTADVATQERVAGLIPGTVSRDVKELFELRATARTLQTSVLRDSAEELKKLAKGKQFDKFFTKIQKLLKVTEAEKQFARESLEGRITTLNDAFDEFIAKAGTPVIKSLGTRMEQLVNTLGGKKGERIGQVLGKSVVRVLDNIFVKLESLKEADISAFFTGIGDGLVTLTDGVMGLASALGTLVGFFKRIGLGFDIAGTRFQEAIGSQLDFLLSPEQREAKQRALAQKKVRLSIEQEEIALAGAVGTPEAAAIKERIESQKALLSRLEQDARTNKELSAERNALLKQQLAALRAQKSGFGVVRPEPGFFERAFDSGASTVGTQ